MKAIVKGFRGVARANISISPIALVLGDNEAGKSSLCQAIAAALTNSGIPFVRPRPGKGGEVSQLIQKKDSRIVVRDGADSGSAAVIGDTDQDGTAMAWPSLRAKCSGRAPMASLYATGLIGFSDLEPRDRAAELGRILKIDPTKDELAATTAVSAEQIDKVWPKVEELGWDGAAEYFATIATKKKGAWEQITGERYGKDKAKEWEPVGWDPSIGAMSSAELEAAVDLAKARADAAIHVDAVSAAEIARLDQLAKLVDALQPAALLAEQEAERADTEEHAARANLDAFPHPEEIGNGQPCPACGASLHIVRSPGGSASIAIAPRETPTEDRAAMIASIDAARVALDAAIADRRRAFAAAHEVNSRLSAAREAAAELAEKRLHQPPTSGQLSRDAAQEALELAQRRLSMHDSVSRAHDTALSITRLQIVAEALRPTGARQTKLTKRLGEFNARLAEITSTAGWPTVVVTSDMGIICGGRPDVLLAASARYRAGVALQLAISERDGSDMVIIDAADILDPDNRNGLFAALAMVGKHALVTMTFDRGDLANAPDLAAAGIGQTYWIDAGTCVPLAEAMAQKAAAE